MTAIDVLTPARMLPSVEVVRLEKPEEATMAKINRHAKITLTPEDVHVRRAFVIHDAVDTFWSQVPAKEIGEFAERAAGAPVIEGHRDNMAPIARIYDGMKVQRPNVVQRGMVEGVGENWWAGVDFYWMRGRSDAEDLALDIDGGVRSEVSGRWKFHHPECSVCRSDMRECDHMPGEMYTGARAWYAMRTITAVREMSFVFRGGQLGTSLEMARGASGGSSPSEIVDAMISGMGMRVAEEERAGMIEFARIYSPRKLSKKQRDGKGWFASLPKRTAARATFFSRRKG